MLLITPDARAQVLRGTFSAGSEHSLAIHADGSLWATGENTYGQLGNGTTTSATGWVPVGSDKDWVQVSAGSDHSLALKANGTAWAWGRNDYGQLGDGTTTGRSVPTAVVGGLYTQLRAGDYFSLALRANGTAWAWGQNDYGQLGDGTTTTRSVPTAVAGGGLYTQLAAGEAHSLALKVNGTIWAWGRNDYGQLGDGTTTARSVPTVVAGSGTYTQLTARGDHNLALKADGTAWAWGNNVFGQLGDGTTTARSVPTAVAGGGLYTQLATGYDFSLGLRADGTAWGWGNNDDNQLGDGTSNGRFVPTLAIGSGYTRLAAGLFHSLGLRADGTLWGWGDNNYGQLGDGTATGGLTPTREATNGTNWTLPAGGPLAVFSLARTVSGLNFASTGQNTQGQLGDGTTTLALRFDRLSPLNSLQPLPVGLTAFTAARTGPAAVQLAWATATETSNDGFGIEQSVDGQTFARLGFVAGTGTTAAPRSYTFEDRAAPAAAYYRLVQTDADGRVTYSPVRFVPGPEMTAGPAAALVLVPNPTRGGAVQVLGIPADAALTVYNALGQCVRTVQVGPLDVHGLPAGVYMVRAGRQAARLVVE